MLAAETMQAAFNTIKEIIPASESLDKGTVVVATVKGDIHDLGKNIVAALLETMVTKSSTSVKTLIQKLSFKLLKTTRRLSLVSVP